MPATTTNDRRTVGSLLASHDFAVIDVETTGLDATTARIVEIAVVHLARDGRRERAWHTLVHPDGPVLGSAIHGIDDADVESAPRFADVAGEVGARLAGRVVVAHNADFDMRHVTAEFARLGLALPPTPVLCTMRLTADLGLDVPNRRLETCLEALGIRNRAAHAALHDAAATARLLASYLALPATLTREALTAWSGPHEPARRDAWPTTRPGVVACPRPGVDLADVDVLPDAAAPDVIAAVAAAIASAPAATSCPRCRARLVERTRRRDGVVFLGCLRFPDCRYARDLLVPTA